LFPSIKDYCSHSDTHACGDCESATCENARADPKCSTSTSLRSVENPGIRKLSPHSKSQRSENIPIVNSLKRTPSELQFNEDEVIADMRDYLMFSRIVQRLAKVQRQSSNGKHNNYKLRRETDLCLAHVIHTRNAAPDWNDQKSRCTATVSNKPDLSRCSIFPRNVIENSQIDDDEAAHDQEMFPLDM
jgi:hypothetical protein